MGVVIRPAEASDLGISNKMPENPEIWKAVGMLDHFEKIQKLKDKIDGVPNFRRVPGYKVFVCGQPTKEGFAAALEKACGDKWPKDGPIIWLNMRQEPILYVNGNPVCARPPNKIGEYAELGDVTRGSVEKDEAEFQRMLKKKAEDDGGKLKVVDVSKKESEIEAKEIMSLTEVIAGVKEKFPGLNHVRIPICNSAKRECDKVIDKNGPPPKGTGIKQLRENIAESKLSYEIMDDAAQAFLKTKIMDNIQKYVYLICFTGYLREQSKIAKDAGAEEFKLSGGKASVPTENLKLAASFCTYMDAHPNFRTICEEGKGKLQWERDIPQDALDNLVSLANADFHANLGKIIHDIYLTGHNLFKDMPQGDHKKRAKYRFASKTLMRILPDA